MAFFITVLSELSALGFAAYLGYFFYGSSEPYTPEVESAIKESFIFCSICAAYWWFQSGTLALSGVKNAISMATDILFSFLPFLVICYVLVDYGRGGLQLSDFEVYAAWFALAMVLMDITFNSMIMARLSRRYLGELGT